MQLLDAHIHLTDKEYASYIQNVILNLRSMRMVACSVTVDTKSTLRSFSLFSSCNDVVKQFVGIHPEAAEREDLEKFKEIFRTNLISINGVGEIGLDGTYNVSYERQLKVFTAMLELAESTGRPVSIHSRKALEDILTILPSYKIKAALLHWFEGSKRQLAKSMELGLFVSYGPVLVYSVDKKVLLKNTDRNRFLVETDGPVRYAKCFKALPAISSSFLVSVVASAASVLGMSYEETAQLLQANAESYFS